MTAENTTLSLEQQISNLEPYLNRILAANNNYEKLAIINEHPLVQAFLNGSERTYPQLSRYLPEYDLPIRSIIAIGQGPIVFNFSHVESKFEKLDFLLKTLLEIESFYEKIGGIIGYHISVLKLLCEQEINEEHEGNVRYIKPEGTDINQDNDEVRKFIRAGIQYLPKIAEMYPVGGAGDRLNLIEEASGEHLPAARLPFIGKSLLEGLIRDLQAREYLYNRLLGEQVTTPIAMMTSVEKNNHQHILGICRENEWFGRPQHSFRFFLQPLAPVITREGNWSLSAPLTLTMKPGGHGVIWKLALEHDIFSSFESEGRRKVLVRQINNPVAGSDYHLLAFSGLGLIQDKDFGFASCPRLLNTAEGMDVLLEKKVGEKEYHCSIANIEYTEFSKKGVHDIPCSQGSSFSAFPANTNILFADIQAIKSSVKICPFPGRNINMKTKAHYISPDGKQSDIEAGRLESTMQNISDSIIDIFDHPIKLDEQPLLKTYISYHERRKTISVTKKTYVPDASFVETPEGCYYDIMQNHRDLLRSYCHVEMPELNDEKDYLANGPSFIVLFHPALGPLYSLIGQKIRGGRLAQGAELQLEIAELDMVNLELEGSLRIIADSVMGKKDSKGILRYSQETGKCVLENVKVLNDGINKQANNCFWKNWIHHHEVLSIVLRGNAEFYAKDVTFKGRQHIEVLDGHRMTAYQEQGIIKFKIEKIDEPSWHWVYFFDSENRIMLKKKWSQEPGK